MNQLNIHTSIQCVSCMVKITTNNALNDDMYEIPKRFLKRS